MRVILQVTSESLAGYRYLLGNNQSLEAGRSELLDIVFKHDAMLSSRHFRVWTENGACYLEDLQSRNGTFVNGQRVMRALLRDGDRILAGTTSIAVLIENAKVVVEKSALTGTVEYPDPVSPHTIPYEVETCDSGISCYSGSTARLPPSSLLTSLGSCLSYLLIVGPSWARVSDGEDHHGTVPLFDWLPEPTRSTSSPVMIIGTAELQQFAASDQAWARDELVAIFWDRSDEPPLEELRRGAGTLARGSVLRPQLRAGAREYVERLMTSLHAVVVPGDSADVWQIYTFRELGPLLHNSGMAPQLPPPANAEIPRPHIASSQVPLAQRSAHP